VRLFGCFDGKEKVMPKFASVVCDRNVSGPAKPLVAYVTKREYNQRPSSNDWTAWEQMNIPKSHRYDLGYAIAFCEQNGYITEYKG
jgi:hypothetical protein